MKLIDTVAIVGFLNPKDRLHARSSEHLQRVSSQDDVFVPVSSLIETDFVLKVSGYSDSEREVSWNAIDSQVPSDKIISNSVSSIQQAIKLQETEGLDYFDSLVASLAKETGSIVITTDKRIGSVTEVEW